MRVLAAVLVTFIAACAEEPAPETFGEGLGTPESPIPNEETTYKVASRVDLTNNGAVPTNVAEIVTNMRAFSQNPARTVLSLADQAALQQLKTAVGTTLANNLEGWINTELDKAKLAGTKTLRQVATEVVQTTETNLTRFYVDSALTMTPEKTSHGLSDLNFRPGSLDIVVLIGGIAADKLMQYPSLAVAEAGAITVGEQKFGLAFGDHAWAGINLASTTLYGNNLQLALVGTINCSTIAKSVALKCSGSSCMGHEGELRALCEGGAAKLIGDLREKVVAVKLETFTVHGGTGKLIDDTNDGLADRIVDGSWDVEINLGGGLRRVAIPFTARK
jgi:hypothetical protein